MSAGSNGADCNLADVIDLLYERLDQQTYAPTMNPTMAPTFLPSISDESSAGSSTGERSTSAGTAIPAIVIVLVALCTTLLFFFCVLSSESCQKQRVVNSPVHPTDSQTGEFEGCEV